MSHVTKDMSQYFAFAFYLATTLYFSLFLEIKLRPMKAKYPEVNLLSIGEPVNQNHCI